MPKKSGHALVEFALAFPVFCSLALASLDLTILFVRQFALERTCAQVARALALTDFSAAQLNAEARRYLGPSSPVLVQISVHALPSRSPAAPFRAPKAVEVIDLTLENKVAPVFPFLRPLLPPDGFLLRSRVREARVRNV